MGVSAAVSTAPVSIHKSFPKRHKPLLPRCIHGRATRISFNPQTLPLFPSFRNSFSTKSKNEKNFNCKSTFSSDSDDGFSSTPSINDDDFIVVNFYRFVYIENPEEEVAKQLLFLQDFDIHGRIYINEQGINAQFSGPVKDSLRYVDWLKKDPKFSEILVQISPSLDNNHAFPKLRLRYKPSLVQYEGGISHLPILESSMRAIPLTPNEWREKLLGNLNDFDRKIVLLDVRNGYEWDIGHFNGAKKPQVDSFRTTSFGLSESESSTANVNVDDDPLSGVDKEKTEVLMYCTGGIRCDVYSTILRQRGYKNLYTLKGGVSNYLQKEGSDGWIGNLFVFDSRLSLPPSAYNPEASANGVDPQPDNDAFARCYICGLQRLKDLRHRNCANLDCNMLILSCNNCVEEFKGCCCSDCMSAPRIRPVLTGPQRYKKWHIYRDAELQKDSIARDYPGHSAAV
ncbi:hypothetical protein MKW98_016020 [Papaver atlanticum]|uniref:Rhodanese domain-containing protein n=1 Tax=Papaver atlanticum TaxID=357466 RepID=A0AAD4X3B8_9MAGN|nr:hypothetical protein MKW98_016020 [Papaver atlanticum]